jgi:hypothetical protein
MEIYMSKLASCTAIGAVLLATTLAHPSLANTNHDGHFTITASTGIDTPSGMNPAYQTGEAVYFSSAGNLVTIEVDNTAGQSLTYGHKAEIGYYSPANDRVVLNIRRQASFPGLVTWSPPANGAIEIDGELSAEVEMTIINPDDYDTEDQYQAFSFMQILTSNSVAASDEHTGGFRIINPY